MTSVNRPDDLLGASRLLCPCPGGASPKHVLEDPPAFCLDLRRTAIRQLMCWTKAQHLHPCGPTASRSDTINGDVLAHIPNTAPAWFMKVPK